MLRIRPGLVALSIMVVAASVAVYPAAAYPATAGSSETHSWTVAGGDPWGWGYNLAGQVGDGTAVNRGTPVAITGQPDVVAVDAGGGPFSQTQGSAHSLALTAGGTVLSWGDNDHGQLGDGTRTDRATPVAVANLSAVVAVSAGGDHSLALKSDGTVWAWGNGSGGKLGSGGSADRTTPVQVANLTGAVAVSAGLTHSVAVRADGTVMAWGDNTNGLLGDGTNMVRSTPVPVPGLADVVGIRAGVQYTLALRAGGTVVSWGRNSGGQLGDGTRTWRSAPQPVAGLDAVTQLTAATDHSLALRADGTVLSWGTSSNGQLGLGLGSGDRLTPTPVGGLTGVVAIDAGSGPVLGSGGLVGGGHSVALKSDGTAVAWGHNGYGQLGNGTTSTGWTPAPVATLSGAVAVTAGGGHSLAITTGG